MTDKASKSGSEANGVTIGIDLGTTNSCVAYQNEVGEVRIIPNDQGGRTTPSYVTYTNYERMIGDASKAMAVTHIDNTVYDSKRLIGRKFSDPDTQEDIKKVTYKVINKDDQPYVKVKYMNKYHQFRPEEVSAVILGYLKDMAEKAIGKPVSSAVITVPAYFNDSQRQATKDAGIMAGLNVTRIINEPTAAAMAYGLNKKDKKCTVLVFDLGGGTFDVSLLSIVPKHGLFKVLATAGDTHLGGEDFDNLVTEFLMEKYIKQTGHDITNDLKARCKIKHAAEKAKCVLSATSSTTVDLSHIGKDPCSVRLSRAKFNNLCASMFEKCLDPVKKVLSDAECPKSQVDEIVMVGGSSRIPKVQDTISEFFGGKKLNLTINPDEAVAYGAAVQAATLSGDKCYDILLMDVTPLSLGVETQGGIMNVVIPRQKTIPVTETKQYHTAKNNQTSVVIKVYEGERQMTKDNNLLGKFELSGIPPKTKHTASIDVTFSLDSNGILSVSAVESSTGVAREIIITNSKGRMSKEELEQKIQEAEKYRKYDEEAKARVSELNETEEYLDNVHESIHKVRGLTDQDKQRLSEISDEGLAWLEAETEGLTSLNIREKRSVWEEEVMSIYNRANAAAGQYRVNSNTNDSNTNASEVEVEDVEPE